MGERFAVESGRRPGSGGVAVATFLSKGALVHRWLSVALGTVTRGIFQIVGGVTRRAGQRDMLVLQGKTRRSMIEGNHSILAVMTGQAVAAEILLVARHRRWIVRGVAVHATVF